MNCGKAASASLSGLLFLICDKEKILVYSFLVKKKTSVEKFPAKNRNEKTIHCHD